MARGRAEARVYIVGDANGFHAACRKATWSAMSMQAKMNAIGGQMQRVGRGMTMGLTLPIVAAGTASVKMALDFEASMSKIRTLVGASDKQMKQYQTAVLKMAKTVGQSPKELSEALYFVTSAGFKGASALRVLEASAKASAAGLGDTATVADAVTSAVNAYGEKTLSAAQSTDILLAAVREGKAEPEAFAGAIGKVIPAASQLGVSFDQVSAAMASMSLTGQSASEAAAALNQVMMNSLKPSKQGADELAKVDLSYQKIRQSLKTDGLLDTLDMLNDAFGGNIESMAKVFGNARSLRAVLALTGSAAGKTATIFDKLSGATGDTDAAFDKAAETSGFKMKQALAQLQVVAIEVGNQLLPVVTQVVQEFGKMVAWFDRLSPGAKSFAVKLAAVTAALGPMIWMGGTAVKTLNVLIVAYKGIAKWAGLAAAAQKTFGASSGVSAAGGASSLAARGVGTGIIGAGGTGAAAAAGSAGMSLGATFAAVAAPIIAGAVAAAIVNKKYHESRSQSDERAAYVGSQRGSMRPGTPVKDPNAPAISGAKTVQKMILDLQVKGATDANADMGKLVKQMDLLQQVASDPILLGKLDGDHTVAELQEIERDMMERLGIGKKQADKIMGAMFKNWNPSAVLNPKINKAAAAAEKRIAALRAKAAKQIKFGNADVSGLINSISSVSSAFNQMGSAARTAGDAAVNALLRSQGATGGGKFKANGGVIYGRQNVTVGEAGPEAIIPLTRPNRAAQVMAEAGLLNGSSGGGTTVNVYLDSEPIAAKVEVRQARKARTRKRTLGLATA